MTKIHRLARPHKFLDAAALESWAEKHANSEFREWETSGLIEYVDFWDWLGQEYPDLFGEFEEWFD